jgi:hypothetical protein
LKKMTIQQRPVPTKAATMIVCQVRPIAYRLEPMLYVVGEKAILNWKAKKYHEDQLRLAGGVGSRSMLDQRP